VSLNKTFVLCFFIFISNAVYGFNFSPEGHLKFQQYSIYTDDDSFYNSLNKQNLSEQNIDFRLLSEKQTGNWNFVVHYQMLYTQGDSISLQNELQTVSPQFVNISGSSQWFNLSRNITTSIDSIWQHNLDRAYIAYNYQQLSIKFGRQVLSWGNGLVFRPMDLFNPFAPNAIYTSYKPGIDMLYGQWLFNSGSDLSALMVPRRNTTSQQLDSSESSSAIKWHYFGENIQADIMLAKDYQDTVLGLGLYGSLYDAIWRLDLVPTFSNDSHRHTSFILNVDTAWQWQQKNLNGFMEYYRNGFGIKQSPYTLSSLSEDLTQRLSRGQLFNTSRDYFAFGLRSEWTPLLQISPLLILNLNDHSRLFFLQANYSLSQNMNLDVGITLSTGKKGSEFAGIETSLNSNIYFQTGQQLFARLNYYF